MTEFIMLFLEQSFIFSFQFNFGLKKYCRLKCIYNTVMFLYIRGFRKLYNTETRNHGKGDLHKILKTPLRAPHTLKKALALKAFSLTLRLN